jgi:SAM-dependent methyltransferase
MPKSINSTAEFFSIYNNFTKTSSVGAWADRLNIRHKALIASNFRAIRGKRILDLGSHDGRWAFAALKSGASFVCGIEARASLIKKAEENFSKYNVPVDQYKFVCADIFTAFKDIEPGQFDTVFCFGIFYHICEHAELLRIIHALRVDTLILDTNVCQAPFPVVIVNREIIDKEGSGLDRHNKKPNKKRALAGIPSASAIELYLEHTNYKWKYYNWTSLRPKSWQGIKDYKEQRRITLVAKPH